MFKLPGKLNASGIPPTALTGVFFGGGTYLFIIRPTAAENDNGNSKH
jgi:hypothetical protein